MKKRSLLISLFPVYAVVLIGCVCIAHFGSDAVTVMVGSAPIPDRTCIVIDAGHGGIDGGATSYSGVLESRTNLEIALRMNDLLHFLGYETRMIRTTDTSVYTEGSTIAAQKVSDLKQRVKTVNETENAILVSIHQNTFPDGRYSGAQVFYADDQESQLLAKELQTAFVTALNPGSKRKSKSSDGIYLMQQIEKSGVLIECGFISNAEEDAKLQSKDYQQKISCVIAATLSRHLESRNTNT